MGGASPRTQWLKSCIMLDPEGLSLLVTVGAVAGTDYVIPSRNIGGSAANLSGPATLPPFINVWLDIED
jgi:hypothetical protein